MTYAALRLSPARSNASGGFLDYDEALISSRRARYSTRGMEELEQWFRRLPRFHTGGVAGGGGLAAGGGGVTRIELVNQTNIQLEAVDNGNRLDGADYVKSIVLRDIRAHGPMSRAIKGIR